MKKYIAEFVGTCFLVIFGCGTAVLLNSLLVGAGIGLPQGFTIPGISLAFGLAIVAMAYSIGNVSGCHINPAVSTGMLICGRMNVYDFIGYVIAQLLGATAGAGILWALFQSNSNLGQNGFGEASVMGFTIGRAALTEIILTFAFVLVILAVTAKEEFKSIAGLVIGLTLTVIHLVGIPITGTSVNPARSFGPAVMSVSSSPVALQQLPVFIIAPIVGAILAALFYRLVIEEDKPETEEYSGETDIVAPRTDRAARDSVIYGEGTEVLGLSEPGEKTESVHRASAAGRTFMKKRQKKTKAVRKERKSRTYKVKTTKELIRQRKDQ